MSSKGESGLLGCSFRKKDCRKGSELMGSCYNRAKVQRRDQSASGNLGDGAPINHRLTEQTCSGVLHSKQCRLRRHVPRCNTHAHLLPKPSKILPSLLAGLPCES